MRPLKIIDDHEVCDEQLRAANDRADKAEADLDRAYERYDKAEQDRNHWHDKAQEYRQQSVEYRESRDKWCEVAVRDQLSSRDTLPRVITADEVEREQVIVLWQATVRPNPIIHGVHVRELQEDWEGDIVARGADGDLYDLSDEFMIILLEDAPDETPKRITVEDIQRSAPGSTWQSARDQIWEWTGEEFLCHLAHSPGMNSSVIPMRAILNNVGPFKRSNAAPRGNYSEPKAPIPDNPWFGTVYEDGTYWAETWRGTPIRPTEIRKGDVYDIHTAHGSTITGIRSARNGVYKHHDGDQYRLVHRP